jgi:voltage-gated potassium channel
LILFGTLGYIFIEKYKFIDALFMTVITISTVGYGVIGSLSEFGIFFTIILIVLSFLIIGLIVQNFTKYISDDDLRKNIRLKKKLRLMKSYKNHVIVCGYGLNGSHAVLELIKNNENVIVIDDNIKVIEQACEIEKGAIFITGDARNEEVLKLANIETAKALITALSIDADNLFVVLTARELNSNLRIISRAVEDSSERKLRRAGADHVILPDSVGGIRMAKQVSEPDVLEFLDYIVAKSGIDVNLVEINCNTLSDKFINKTLHQLDIRKKTGANVIGIKLENGTYIFNPAANTIIEKNVKIFVLGTPEQILNLKELTLTIMNKSYTKT